ncbi:MULTISPECIES: hypothetical protein [Nocardia]|jgi:hypothetical protein|uniref:hypothetical protein n=1 Tax=Nocardia abscessus TaxID=120957 RepID=UPI00189558AB|nr:hypothetical protein [Nocardia abscessus]MBF6470367.1 hypothetical protein [Nocardia abscessus]
MQTLTGLLNYHQTTAATADRYVARGTPSPMRTPIAHSGPVRVEMRTNVWLVGGDGVTTSPLMPPPRQRPKLF